MRESEKTEGSVRSREIILYDINVIPTFSLIVIFYSIRDMTSLSLSSSFSLALWLFLLLLFLSISFYLTHSLCLSLSFFLSLPDPLFRSGSTLLETMLDSHNAIWGLGEDSVFNANLPFLRDEIVEATQSGGDIQTILEKHSGLHHIISHIDIPYFTCY